MKFLRFSGLVVLIGGFMLLASCGKGKDPEPSIEEKQLTLLSKTWVLTLAEFNNSPVSAYTGMTITISGTFNDSPGTSYNYSLTGLPTGTGVKVPWPRTANATTGSGTWRFAEDSPASSLFREDADGDLPMGYTVTKDKLTIQFDFNGAGYRTSSVDGQWNFEFSPQ